MRDGRDRILEAASSAFAARGYGATSMSDLRRAAGASTGSLYHHFPTKEHVAAALFLEALGDFQAGFAGVLARHAEDARAGVTEGVRFHLGWIESQPRRARLLVAELDPAVLEVAQERLAAQNRSFFGAIGDWRRRAVARGEIDDHRGEVTYALWLGPAQEHGRAWLAGRARTSPTRAAEALATGAWRSLGCAR